MSDFFLVEPEAHYSVVVGNPPYIRYQDFTGESRTRSRAAALKAGVSLTALASSWAAFTVHSALFLQDGGRMGLVLPAELLSVNYAAAVRQFLFDRFRSVELVLFAEQVFPEAEADVVLLLADGFNEGPTDHATIYQAQDADALASLSGSLTWKPTDPSAKWTGLLVDPDAVELLRTLRAEGHFTSLDTWGDTTLGMVTGNNRYFALSPAAPRSAVSCVRHIPMGGMLRRLAFIRSRLAEQSRTFRWPRRAAWRACLTARVVSCTRWSGLETTPSGTSTSGANRYEGCDGVVGAPYERSGLTRGAYSRGERSSPSVVMPRH